MIEMELLTQLKLSNVKRSNNLSQVERQRNKLVGKIDEQIKLAEAQQQGKTFTRTRWKIARNSDGTTSTVEYVQRVRQWWWKTDNNKLFLNIRYGNKVIELAKGKGTIEVESVEQLIDTLKLVQDAASKGELDMHIAAASAAVRKRFTK